MQVATPVEAECKNRITQILFSSLLEPRRCQELGAARLQWGAPFLYRLGGLADLFARFAVEALWAPWRPFWEATVASHADAKNTLTAQVLSMWCVVLSVMDPPCCSGWAQLP